MSDMIDSLTLENDRGIRHSVPANLYCLTTFALLEQNRWFEREVDFVHRLAKPGVIALDIGANVGIYTLPLALGAGVSGRVYAYEPGTENCGHLEHSLELNGLVNTTVSSAALSDFAGKGVLKLGNSGELHQLVAAPEDGDYVEFVEVTTLDSELHRRRWPCVDFVKLDAEGQESAILDGGQEFFRTYSPLVMFEAVHGRKFASDLNAKFRENGFDIYRLLGDGSILAQVDDDDPFDAFDLNFFAARPETAAGLSAEGLLARKGGSTVLSGAERMDAIAGYCQLPMARSLEISTDDVEQCAYAAAFVKYAAFRFLPSLNPDRRHALLLAAYDELASYCSQSNSSTALSTLARIAWDCGFHIVSLDVLEHLIHCESHLIDSPFFPPAAKFESLNASASEDWFDYALRETREFGRSRSSIFGNDLPALERLARSEHASEDLFKRLILIHLAHGEPISKLDSYFKSLDAFDLPRLQVWAENVRMLAARRP